MYLRIAPVVRKLSPTVDIFFIILSCLLEKGIEIEVPCMGSMSPVRPVRPVPFWSVPSEASKITN